jgi:hypothetical protein
MRRQTLLALLLLIAVASLSPAQRTPLNPAGTFDGYDFLLVNESVHKELKLSDEQISKANQVVHDIRQSHLREVEKLRSLPPPAGTQKFLQLARTYSEEALKKAKDFLTPEQLRRLKQIKLQASGVRAFSDPDVAKTLALTAGQKEQIKKIEEDIQDKGKEALKADGRNNAQDALARLGALHKAGIKAATALLTPSQSKNWKEMNGEPFEFKFETPFDRKPASDKPEQRVRAVRKGTGLLNSLH